MKKLWQLFMLLFPLALTAQQPENNVITQKVEGYIFKPKEVKPSDDHLRTLKLPSGFTISKFAEDVGKPRMIKVSSNGSVYVTDRDSGTVTMLVDADGDGKADSRKVVLRQEHVHGIDIVNDEVYLVTIWDVYKAKIGSDGSFTNMQKIMTGLPDAGQHPNRTIRVGPDKKLYITVGSTCNACKEPNKENATIVQADLDGKNRMVFAKGLRNTIGFDWHPQSGKLYGFDHGIDWLGNDEQKEELNKITKGTDYGWPYVFENGKPNKADKPENMTWEEYAAKTKAPEWLHTAHAAPIDFLFYKGNQFPEQYRGHAFAAMHGSWNRQTPVGYNLVLVRFENGKPAGIEDFVSDFLTADKQSYFGRPCGLAVHKDGSLLMTDDAMGVVYRISYKK